MSIVDDFLSILYMNYTLDTNNVQHTIYDNPDIFLFGETIDAFVGKMRDTYGDCTEDYLISKKSLHLQLCGPMAIFMEEIN